MADRPRPLFRRIAADLRDRIEDGTLAVGSLLPTEALLMQRHGVSRHTVRDALSELRAQGLVAGRQGIGTEVLRRRARASQAEVHSTLENLIRSAKESPVEVYAVETVVADATLAELVRGRRGQSYLRILGTRGGTDGTPPVGHVEIYLDAAYAEVLDQLHNLHQSVAETVEAVCGIRITRIEQEIAAEVLPPDAADRIDAEPGSSALRIRRWYTSGNGRIFEVAISHYPTGRFVYRNVMMRGGGASAE